MTTETRYANAIAMLTKAGAPMTRANLTRLAVQYERAYRRSRASKRPPARHLLVGQLDTARAFYRLARRAES